MSFSVGVLTLTSDLSAQVVVCVVAFHRDSVLSLSSWIFSHSSIYSNQNVIAAVTHPECFMNWVSNRRWVKGRAFWLWLLMSCYWNWRSVFKSLFSYFFIQQETNHDSNEIMTHKQSSPLSVKSVCWLQFPDNCQTLIFERNHSQWLILCGYTAL